MKTIILLAGICICTSLTAQTIPEEDQLILEQRESNLTFLNQTLIYAALSYASPPFSDIGSPKEGYILSADISPQFALGGKRMRFPIHLTPRYKVRIFRDNAANGDNSLPVRTPSYMPGASIYIPTKKITEETKDIKFLSLSYFHHSNGQDGNEFNPDGTFNLYNGNFSTNFIEPAYHFRKRFINNFCDQSDGATKTNPYYDLYGKIGLEKHFLTAEKLKSSYGDYRLNIMLGLIRARKYADKINGRKYEESYVSERYRVTLNSTFIMGSRDVLNEASRRININVNYHYRIPSSPNAAAFIGAGYYGSDTYNIYYSQNYFYVNAGFALGFFITANDNRKL